MPAEAELSALKVLLDQLRSRLQLQRNEPGPDQEALRDVFRVNNEIGRLSRLHPSFRPRLTDLQARVNLVTIELKRADRRRALEALRDVEHSFGGMMNDSDAP